MSAARSVRLAFDFMVVNNKELGVTNFKIGIERDHKCAYVLCEMKTKQRLEVMLRQIKAGRTCSGGNNVNLQPLIKMSYRPKHMKELQISFSSLQKFSSRNSGLQIFLQV